MKKYALLLLATLTLGLYSCEKENEQLTNEEQPVISLEKSSEGINSLSFKVKTTHTSEARYMVLEDEETVPTLETILSEGTEIELAEDGTATVTVEGLDAETSYKVVAAAKNIAKKAGSNTLYVTTLAPETLVLTAEIVQVDHEKMNFRVHSENIDKIAYLVVYANRETPSTQYVLLNGENIEVGTKESVEVTGLECSKDYKLVVAGEGADQTTMIEPITFRTDDDPDQVIKHEYTRARGTKYGSSYFMMFSYEDASEEDNFAYNEETLSLDFYGDPNKDYLPAGTYEVKESTDPDCISSYRYSTYGYDNGVQLKSGQAVVSIDPDTKAYTFEIDLYLKDGRHLEATYTGDVDNMPVIDIITLDMNFNTASASTTDNGDNWTLNFEDATGNKAKFNLRNAFVAPYIANNIYTINTSSESYVAGVVETGQFDAESSSLTIAGETGELKFLTGSIHVNIDWNQQKYLISFYGTAEGNYTVEAEYEGPINGISLVQSQEIIEVVLNTATANSYSNNTNWYITFTQTINGNENYRIVLDAHCPAFDYLPSGTYRLNNSDGSYYLGADATTLYILGEGQYNAVEANASVNADLTTKTYSIDISFKLEDGRTYKLAYTGVIDGMAIVDPEDVPDDIEWETFTAKHWYSDNWALTIISADEQYKIEFDLRTGDSSANYLISGQYRLGDTGQYIDANYSKFNGNGNAFKDATLNVNYNEADETYELDFDVTLNDDRNFTGSYSGAIAGSPKE